MTCYKVAMILSDEEVQAILNKLDPMYASLMARHMASLARKSYNDGLREGKIERPKESAKEEFSVFGLTSGFHRGN